MGYFSSFRKDKANIFNELSQNHAVCDGKKAYLVDFIGFMIAKVKNISHLFSMSYMASGNRW